MTAALNALVAVYGVLLIVLGAYGYLFTESKSIVSLIAGGAAGLLTLAFLWYTKTNPRVGRIGNAVVALALAGQFLPKALKGPASPGDAIWHVWTIALASILVFLALGAGHMMAMKGKGRIRGV